MKPPQGERGLKTEDTISGLLRIGVAASLALITAGSLLSFLRHGEYGVQAGEVARLTGPEGSFPRTWAWLAGGLMRLDGRSVIVLGLLLLMATPVLRVAVSMVAFAKEGDRTYVILTALVLILLLISVEIGRAT